MRDSFFQGARVVGSDIDSDSLFPKTSKSGSKNGRFRRKDGSLQWDKTPEDNFEFYKTRSQLLDLFAADVKDWCAPVGISSPENEITKYSTVCCTFSTETTISHQNNGCRFF